MANKTFILAHLDDDPLELKRFERSVSSRGLTAGSIFKIHSFVSSESFLNFIAHHHIDFCVLDIILSSEEKIDGLSLIQKIKNRHPQCVVVVSSFNDNPAWILKALSLQADDFFSKKVWPANFSERLLKTYHYSQIKSGFIPHVTSSQNVPQKEYSHCAGKTLKAIEKRVPLILQSAVRSVLIEGESGTGKEVVADIFEYYTKNFPFVRLNCAALSQNLLESELFGHRKGAFTGAVSDKIGFIETAHNGFLFLDEVSSLSLSAQSALLRAIENQQIIRLGETETRKINVRFICATNVSLDNLVEKNEFRKDLLQRLREVEIYLPPLSERKEEISELIDFFCSKFKENAYSIEPLAKDLLCALDWKEGNVRELRNTLRAMTEFSQNGILTVNSIPTRFFVKTFSEPKVETEDTHIKLFLHSENGELLKYNELCENLLSQIIAHYKKKDVKLNVSKLAKELCISRTTLYDKIKINLLK